jgi:hypothetical protein
MDISVISRQHRRCFRRRLLLNGLQTPSDLSGVNNPNSWWMRRYLRIMALICTISACAVLRTFDRLTFDQTMTLVLSMPIMKP